MRFRFSSLLGVSIPVVVLLGGTFHFFMFEFFLGGLMRSAGMEYSFVVKESVDIKRFEKILKLNDICLSVEAADDIEGMEFLFGNPMREPLCVKIPIEKILKEFEIESWSEYYQRSVKMRSDILKKIN